MNSLLPLLFCAAAALAANPLRAAEETQSVLFDRNKAELTSSALVKLLNSKLDAAYQDLELVVTACHGGEFATRAAGANGLKGTWSVSTATDIDRTNTTFADPIDGAGNFRIRGGTFNGWMPAWVSKVLADGNKIGNKALFDYATAEKHKAIEGSSPQYRSSGKTADDMTLHGGKSSNHAIVFQTTGYVRMLDGTIDALKAAGYTDAEIKRMPDRDLTWDKFGTALDDLRKKLDVHKNEEKALIILETHGDKESRTVSYAPGQQNQAGGGALVSALAPVFTMEVTDAVVLASLGQDLPRPGGGVYAHDPLRARFGPATLRLSTFEEHLSAGSVSVALNGLAFGALQTRGSGTGGDYQMQIPDEVLSQVLGTVMQTGRLDVSFEFASSSDWFRIAVPEDWLDPSYANLDYGIGIAGNCCDANLVPEPPSVLLLGLGLGLVGTLAARRSRRPARR